MQRTGLFDYSLAVVGGASRSLGGLWLGWGWMCGAVFLLSVWGVAHAGSGQRVIVIGVDGLSPDGVRRAETPVMDRMMAGGVWSLRGRGVMPTSSSPNWASMIMGAGPEQHGITSNDWETNKVEVTPTVTGPGGVFPTIFDVVIGGSGGSAITACIYDWGGFGRLLGGTVPTVFEHVSGSAATARRAVEVIRERKPDLLFVHFDDVDHAGHEQGYGTGEYLRSVEHVDGLVGQILGAVEDAGLGESTYVLVTSDHGGVGKGHGGATTAELEIPWILVGPGIRRGWELERMLNTYDTAATVVKLLGYSPHPGWIGRPVVEALTER